MRHEADREQKFVAFQPQDSREIKGEGTGQSCDSVFPGNRVVLTAQPMLTENGAAPERRSTSGAHKLFGCRDAGEAEQPVFSHAQACQ